MPLKNKLTLAAFIAKFSSEKACYEYLAKKRWPNGFVCPSCKGTHGWMLADGKYECSHCHKQVSATAGTVMHRSHVPLTNLFLTDKEKVFCALSLNSENKPLLLKLKTTKDMCQKSVAEFAKSAIKQGSTIHTDGYRSYKKGLLCLLPLYRRGGKKASTP